MLVQKLLWNVKSFISFTPSSHFLLVHKFSWCFIITIFPCMTKLSACTETSLKFQKYHFIFVSLYISCETASCQSYIWNSSDNCSSLRKCKIREMYLQLCMFLSFGFFLGRNLLIIFQIYWMDKKEHLIFTMYFKSKCSFFLIYFQSKICWFSFADQAIWSLSYIVLQ